MPTTLGHKTFVIDYGHSGPYPAYLTQVPSRSHGNSCLFSNQSKRKKWGKGGRRSFFLLHSPGVLILLFFAEKQKTFEVEIIYTEKVREKIMFHNK